MFKENDGPIGPGGEPYAIYQARRQIYATYGDNISISEKSKSLLKFGKNPDVDTDIETIWSQGGDETYLTDNLIDSISSSDAGDTSTVTLEYHTVSGTGTDQQFTFGIQTVALTGQTRKALTTACARTSRGYIAAGQTALAGDVYVYENTALTAGVPNDATKIHLKVASAAQQSEKCASTISNADYYIVSSVYGGVSQKTAGVIAFTLETREPGGVFRRRLEWSGGSDAAPQYLDPYFIIPKNHDFRVRGIGSAVNLEGDAWVNGYLAKVQTS